MTFTLLLDLDNTLLDNPMDAFLPAYLGALSRRLAVFVKPDRMVRTLMAATSQMMQNNEPDRTLMEVFDATFFPALGLDKTVVQPVIDSFYAEDFPKLRAITQPRPGAVHLVEQAFGRGYRVGVATNPVFPRSAILQRLEWAGLSASQYPFELIPDYTSFHFAKPNPAYFAEYLAQIGFPDGLVVMVGDEEDVDVNAARQYNMPAFWISTDKPATSGVNAALAQGKFEDILGWTDILASQEYRPTPRKPSVLLHALNGVPAALLTLSRQLSGELWMRKAAQAEWSPVEIACHLRDVEAEVNLPRMTTVRQVKNPFLPVQDTDSWAETRQYIRQDGPLALLEFVRCRKEMLSLLRSFNDADWELSTRHAIFGPTRLHELVELITEHDRIHVQQFIRSVK